MKRIRNSWKKSLLANIIILALFACSKNNSEPVATEQIYLPEEISLEYSFGDTVSYKFTYKDENQIEQLYITRVSDDDNILLKWYFQYDNEGLLKKVETDDSQEELDYEIIFTYGANSVITNILMILNETEFETTVFYNPNDFIYGVDGDLGNLPSSWRFDIDGTFMEMYIGTNQFIPEFSETGKGIFNDINVQPAHNIWFGLAYFLTNYELYYFSKKDIKSLMSTDFDYSYQNKVRDGNGNLIAFQMNVGGLLTIDYTIDYEKRDL